MRICDAVTRRHLRFRLGVIAGLVVLAAGVLPPAASAATIGVNKKCYVNANPASGAPVTMVGGGFTAGDPVHVTGTGVSATSTASAAGALRARFKAPILPTVDPASRRFTLTATDAFNPAATATTQIQVANLAVKPTPSFVRPTTRKVTFSFSGFTPGKHIYAHYLRKKVLARSMFGKAKGPCGLLKQKARLYPGGHPHFKQYKVVIDNSKRYSRHSRPQLVATLTVE
jgi:hypothetical protein